MSSIRAVYRDGQLRLLEPLNLRDGDEVEIQIVTSPVRLADAVADMLVRYDDDGEEIDEDALQKQLDDALQGQRLLSEIIIADRYEDA